MKYKMVVIDIDGTLVDKHGNIAPEDKAAVTRLDNSSVVVSLCTGRVIKASMPVIKELRLNNFHIFYDGALIYNPGNMSTIYAKPLDAAIVREAIDFSRKNDIYLELYSSERFFSERPNWSDEVHRKFFRVEPTKVNFDDIWNKERILKAEVVVHNDEEAVKAKLFEGNFGDRLRYSIARSPAYPDIDFINIVNPQVSKGEALGKLLEYYGYQASETIAIGDGLNDIPLLKAAGVSVAMGNAFPEVKEASLYITQDIEQHGVAAAINFFFPV
ncbi:MAG: HAD family phosphatase [Dehalococcoidia bacterium]|nr:MAG: HAD family phosphatase [Dehalococcoidia bacterium]